jgi:K+-transporting ATPase c subunit
MTMTSASGLDPEISSAHVALQVRRVAAAQLHGRADLGGVGPVLSASSGEPRVNVLELNLDLHDRQPLN